MFEDGAVTSAINMLIKAVSMFSVNRYRDSHYGPPDKAQSDEAGMRDCTEFENKDFRYVL